MQKNGAAAAGYPRTNVVVDLDDEVVEMIVPPEPVARLIRRAAERPVVTAVAGIFRPGDIRGDPPDR